MTLLPLFGKEYILSLTIGCFLANIIGPYGVPDIILGTLATFISVYLVYLTGKHMKDKKGYLIIASLWPTIVNAIIVGGVMLHGLFKLPLISFYFRGRIWTICGNNYNRCSFIQIFK